MASQILNDIYEGLKAPANPAISTVQLKSAISVMRNRLLDELARSGRLERKDLFVQYCAPLAEVDDCGARRLQAAFPPAISLYGVDPFRYVGYPDGDRPLKIATLRPRQGRFHRLTGGAPTVYLTRDGVATLFSEPDQLLDSLLLEYIPEDPRQLVPDDAPYPIPGWLDGMICAKLTETYVRHYSMKNPRPVTGADIISMAMAAGTSPKTDEQ